MADETNQSMGGSDPNTDSFTFVDKRRAADDAEAHEASADVDLDPADATADADSADGPDATHQIALYAVGLLQMNAFQQLGLISDPGTGKATRDLVQARLAIDCVAALADVLEGPNSTLEPKLQQDIRRVLTDLRLNYVTQTKLAEGEAK